MEFREKATTLAAFFMGKSSSEQRDLGPPPRPHSIPGPLQVPFTGPRLWCGVFLSPWASNSEGLLSGGSALP